MVENLAFAPATASQGYDPELYTPAEDKKEYSMTWVEWNAQNSLQIIKNGETTGSITHLYQVPEGFTLYITTAYMTFENGHQTIKREANLQIGDQVAFLTLTTTFLNNANISQQYFMPLLAQAGEVIKLVPSSGGFSSANCQAGFTGFIIKFKS